MTLAVVADAGGGGVVQMATQGPHGLPADLWSIGCLFYTLVAGKAPFQVRQTDTGVIRIIT